MVEGRDDMGSDHAADSGGAGRQGSIEYCVHSHLLHLTLSIILGILISYITQFVSFPTPAEKDGIISGIRWIGLLWSHRATIRADTILNTLCGRLEELMKYEPGECGRVMLQHKFVIK